MCLGPRSWFNLRSFLNGLDWMLNTDQVQHLLCGSVFATAVLHITQAFCDSGAKVSPVIVNLTMRNKIERSEGTHSKEKRNRQRKHGQQKTDRNHVKKEVCSNSTHCVHDETWLCWGGQGLSWPSYPSAKKSLINDSTQGTYQHAQHWKQNVLALRTKTHF